MTVMPGAIPPRPPRRRAKWITPSGTTVRITGSLDDKHQDLTEFHMVRRACAVHQVTYIVSEDDSKDCPVCKLEVEVKELKEKLQRTANDLQLSMQNSERLSVQVNELDAMRKALTLISKEDLAFAKSIAYRFKADETAFTLIATQDADDRWQFLVRMKRGIAEEHICTSLGGIALAVAYQQAMKMAGNIKATQMLVRAVAQHLAMLEDS